MFSCRGAVATSPASLKRAAGSRIMQRSMTVAICGDSDGLRTLAGDWLPARIAEIREYPVNFAKG